MWRLGRRRLGGGGLVGGVERGGEGEGEVTAAVEGHAGCAGQVVLGGADFLDGLLGHDVAGCEEDLLGGLERRVVFRSGFGARTAVVMLWVRSGRRASLVWYLGLRGWLVVGWLRGGKWRVPS